MIKDISLYEVTKQEYRSYFKRIPVDVCYVDVECDAEGKEISTNYFEFGTNKHICGFITYEDGTEKYYIYNLLDEGKLLPPIGEIELTVSQEEYYELLKAAFETYKKKEEEEE